MSVDTRSILHRPWTVRPAYEPGLQQSSASADVAADVSAKDSPYSGVHTQPQADSGGLDVSPHLVKQAASIFAIGHHVETHDGFEDGMNNEFRTAIQQFLRHGAGEELAVIALLITSQSAAVRAETILCLGEEKSPVTYDQRLKLALDLLEDRDPEVRDAASLALVDLNSRFALPYLKAAAAREPLRSLRRDIEQAYRSLKQRA